MTTVNLNTDGPRDPQYVLEVAEALSQAARVLNHLTRSHEALEYPSEADTLLRYVSAAAAALPQLLGQVTGWLAAEDDAGRIEMASGSRYPSASLAADVVRLKLEVAAADAKRLQESLDSAASVTSEMAAREDDGGE